MRAIIVLASGKYLGRRIIFKYLNSDHEQPAKECRSLKALLPHQDLPVPRQPYTEKKNAAGSRTNSPSNAPAFKNRSSELESKQKKKIFGIDKDFLFDLFVPKDAHYQNRVQDLSVDDNRFVYYPFVYPDKEQYSAL